MSGNEVREDILKFIANELLEWRDEPKDEVREAVEVSLYEIQGYLYELEIKEIK